MRTITLLNQYDELFFQVTFDNRADWDVWWGKSLALFHEEMFYGRFKIHQLAVQEAMDDLEVLLDFSVDDKDELERRALLLASLFRWMIGGKPPYVDLVVSLREMRFNWPELIDVESLMMPMTNAHKYKAMRESCRSGLVTVEQFNTLGGG
ncbi:hypothetical protein ACPV5O_20805 [Vibrio maritimus]|uniref:hypothetical protein n=1 Tax=Vibrio maritimus TaxID=990268 RepID=UPI0040693D2F